MTELFAGPLGPLIIFGFRIVDVSLATIRMLLTMRDQRTLVPLIGFVEVTIWVVAVGTAIQNLHSVWHVLGYSGGFAAGTGVGLWIEGKLAMGLATVRIICRDPGVGEDVADALREKGFGVTEFHGQGRQGRVDFLYTLVKRRHIPAVIAEVERWDDDAFITVEEPRTIRRGWMFTRRRK
jgi:uncharacterized protein YebE (UPF0316 family)